MSKEKSYKELREELDTIVTELQAGDLDIDEATKQYQRGMKLVAELEAYLKKSELSIKKISKK